MKFRFTDQHGAEASTLQNDGETLRVTLRGVTFEGNDFDCLTPEGDYPPEQLALFTIQNGGLSECSFDVEMPLQVAREVEGEEQLLPAMLLIHLELRASEEELELRLVFDGRTFTSSGTSGWFEDELRKLQQQLPSNEYMKICFMCAFSDYSPYGHGLFGDLACFRDQKEKYSQVDSKIKLFALWDLMTEFIQETHLCPSFQRRKPNTGYRG